MCCTLLPTITEDEEISLYFWQFFEYGSYNGDGNVYIYYLEEDNWRKKRLGESANENAEGWSQTKYDLSQYSENTIQIAFYHNGSYPDLGWYIDEVEILKQKRHIWTGSLENFENGWNGWYADQAIWQIGSPEIEELENAHSGSTCVGTVINGKYPSTSNSSLLSPIINLPEISQTEEIYLRFWQFFKYGSFNGDGNVYIKYWEEDRWKKTRLGESADNNAEGWSQTRFDLSDYSGKKVQIVFYHDGSYADIGWYIDDVEIISPSIPVPPNPEKLSGCINAKNITGRIMLLQSDEYHQTVNLDAKGCYEFERYNKNKPFTLILRVNGDNDHILSE